ncbi:MAG: hypothetical protein QXO51_07470 [Halobacteria archaeon]
MDRDDRAVSEVVGYLIIFAIVMLAMSVIYVNSLSAMLRTEEQSYLANVDQSFKVMSFNINRILAGSAPAQSMEVRLRDSTISLLQKSTLNVSWMNRTSGGNDTTGVETLATVEHYFRDRKIAYEGGGVWTKSPDGGVAMLSAPPFIVDNTTVIPYATLSTANTSRSGRSLVHVELEVPCRVLGQCAPPVETKINATRVTLNVTSEYCDGWKTFFERTLEFAAAHFDDADCADNRVIANVTRRLSGANTTLHLADVAMQGSIQ